MKTRSFFSDGMEPFTKKLKTNNEVSTISSSLPEDVILNIFSNLSLKNISENSQFVCKIWHKAANYKFDQCRNSNRFDLLNWSLFLGSPPPTQEELTATYLSLPNNLKKIMMHPCPFYPEKLILETHKLIYIAPTIGDKKVTLITIEKALFNHLPAIEQKLTPKYNESQQKWVETIVTKKRTMGFTIMPIIWQQLFKNGEFDLKIDKPQWALMLNEILPDSFNLKSNDQKTLLKIFKISPELNYEFPTTAQAIGISITEIASKGKILIHGLSRCKETIGAWSNVVVGNTEETEYGIELSTNSGDGLACVGVIPTIRL